MLFQKLSELTKQSPLVTIAIAREGAKLRVTITPKYGESLGEKEKVEPHEAALVTPLSVLGTAEELDAGLLPELERYCTAHEKLQSAVGDYETEMKVAELGMKAKTAEHQKKRGATPALAQRTPTAALPAPEAAPEAPKVLTGKAAALADK